MSAERRRLTLALLLSLLIHALLLSLTGGQGPGLPGFAWPWQERRITAPDLRIVLMPATDAVAASPGPAVKAPWPRASIGPPGAGGLAQPPSVSAALAPSPTAAAIVPEPEATAAATPEPEAANGAGPAHAPRRNEGSADATFALAPAPAPAPAVIAMEPSDETTLVVPAAPVVPMPVNAAAPSASSPETVSPALPEARDAAPEAAARIEIARQEAARDEAERLENARLEAQRREAAREEAARQEAQRVEVARLEAEGRAAARQALARQEAARQEAQRLEVARLEAEGQAAARQALARQEAARQEAQRVEAARLEAERQEAERQVAAQQAAARQETARLEAALQDATRREEVLRAIGRQLDEEAARRDAASTAAGLPSGPVPSSSGARRGRLFGRTDANVELVLYAEAWARKIQLNMTFDSVREAAKRPHTDPLVTVAIRSDGSVESVTFVLSSGVAEIDAAIRRIVQSQMPYPAFPPGLAREFDVIEIRRTWHFDMAIRLY